jgi:arylsulfatase A-like enzyme
MILSRKRLNMKNVIQNKLLMGILVSTFFVIATLLLLHVVNLIRLDTSVFHESAEILLKRSRQISEQARQGYQTEVLDTLHSNPNNGNFFRFDDMLSEAVVREKPSVPLQKRMSGVIFSFEFDNPTKPGLVPTLGRSTAKLESGLIRIKHDSSDYLTNDIPIQIPAQDIADIVIRARGNKGTKMTLGWQKEDKPAKLGGNRLDIDFIADNNFHTYVVNAKNALRRDLVSGDRIGRIFLRPSNVNGAIVEIDFVRFISKLAKYQERPSGTDYETVGTEMRRVLYMLPPQTLEYSLQVPDGSPVLDFGIGVLNDNKPVDFEISISDSNGTEKFYNERVTNASEWRDARLSLSRWAGRQVRLYLRVSGSLDNVAFFSNPILYSPPTKRFNIIIILEDALRADHLSTYGYSLPTSPFKDRLLAENGVVFLNAISQATSTRPSVPTLMTSLLPTATGVWYFSDMLSGRYLTLAEIMRSQGFATASFIQNGNAGTYAGLHQGFSWLFDEESMGYQTEGILEDPLSSWLNRYNDRNLFVYLHIADPHGEYDPPAPFDSWYREAPSKSTPVMSNDALDPAWVEHPTLEGRRLLYDGEIRHNDEVLEDFIQELATLGLQRNTLLIFLADHGEYLGEHNLWQHHPPGYLQVIGVPLMIVYPARFDRSKRIPQMVQLIDVMPTILELAGVDTSRLLMQGDSLVDLIEGRRTEYWDNRICVSEEPLRMQKDDPAVSGSLFFREWHLISSKYIWSYGLGRLPAPLRLKVFNFRNDHQETRMAYSFLPDLYMKYKFARVLGELQFNNRDAWKRWTASEQGDIYRHDPDVIQRLRDLGYAR